MPVNLIEIQKQIKEIGKQVGPRQQLIRDRCLQARSMLAKCANDLESLRQLVSRALAENSGLRCAVPLSENLDLIRSRPLLEEPIILLAADGSQIEPDRHAQVEFAVINVGAFRMTVGYPLVETPQEITRSRLFYGDELHPANGPLNEDLIALLRDLEERKTLVELAAKEEKQVIALTDGPMELFLEPKDREVFKQPFTDYIDTLKRLSHLGALTAGYVDKPRADLVVRLLELILLSPDNLGQAGRNRPLEGVSDSDLFEPLLSPGERSAVFALQSTATRNYNNEIALHFFYLKIGNRQNSALARVEIPAWVANDAARIDKVHSALVNQCEQLGSRPYPYALHRAHEIAVVRREEKQTLEDMIVSELYRQGIQVGDKSNKQWIKDNSGSRKRY